MTYKAKVPLCSQMRTKQSTQTEHRVEFLNVKPYSSPNIVRVIKSRRMRWAGHVARMGEERAVCWVLLGKTEGKETTGET